MGSNSGAVQSSTQSSMPWDALQQPIRDTVANANQLYSQPYQPYEGQTIAGPSDSTVAGYGLGYQRATLGAPDLNAARGSTADISGGAFFGQGPTATNSWLNNTAQGGNLASNPYLTDQYTNNAINFNANQMGNAFATGTAAQNDAAFARGGAYGGSAWQQKQSADASGLAQQVGGVTWTATFTPTANILDTSNVITLNNAGVFDAAGNAGLGTTNSNNYAIDTLRPTVSIVVADPALQAGETTLVTFTFNEAVSDFGNADLTFANGTLTAVSASDGGVTWTATFTPTADVLDTSNVITLVCGGGRSVGQCRARHRLLGQLRDRHAASDGSIVVADTALKAGETSLVTFTFNEAVSDFGNADLTFANGTLTAVSASEDGVTWTATFTPTADVLDTSNVITLDQAGVFDPSGNAGLGTASSGNFAIDTLRPTVRSWWPTPR